MRPTSSLPTLSFPAKKPPEIHQISITPQTNLHRRWCYSIKLPFPSRQNHAGSIAERSRKPRRFDVQIVVDWQHFAQDVTAPDIMILHDIRNTVVLKFGGFKFRRKVPNSNEFLRRHPSSAQFTHVAWKFAGILMHFSTQFKLIFSYFFHMQSADPRAETTNKDHDLMSYLPAGSVSEQIIFFVIFSSIFCQCRVSFFCHFVVFVIVSSFFRHYVIFCVCHFVVFLSFSLFFCQIRKHDEMTQKRQKQ